jgi:EAL domain-containing protein (putative c-di-GMP-specific phosphodiesterase class I)
MAKKRTEPAEQIAELLDTARRSLGLSLAFLTRMDGETQHLEVVESSIPLLFRDGIERPQATSLCQAILDGKLPPVMSDLTDFPDAMRLPAAKVPRFRSFVSVPVTLSDGSLYGTFCAAGFKADRELTNRDKPLMDVLAHAASVVLEPELRELTRRQEIEERLDPVIAAGGPTVVLQPIVQLSTGLRVGAEALSRFPAEHHRTPDLWFADAHTLGEGEHLELQAIERGAEHLTTVSGYVALNVSPGTLLTKECTRLLRRLPLERVVLELSEHEPVDDYDALRAVLNPLRAQGARLAIDDVGAGYASLRHIVLTSPDIIKLDRSNIDGIAADPVLVTLVRALVEFGHGLGAQVVAEGVETADDAQRLHELGVDYAQGWYFGRPGPPEQLSDAVAEISPARSGGTVPPPAPVRLAAASGSGSPAGSTG